MAFTGSRTLDEPLLGASATDPCRGRSDRPTVAGMVRRLGGVVVIAVACLVLGIIAAVASRNVAGTALLPAGAVVPGTCIGPVGSPFDHPVSTGAGEGEQQWETATYAYPVATVVDCGQPHAGEILSLDIAADAPAAGTLPQLDALDAACQKQVDGGQAGSALQPYLDQGSHWFIAWEPDVPAQGRAIGPSRADRAAGERWSACAVIGTEGSTLFGPSGSLGPGECLSVGDVQRLSSTDDDGVYLLADPRIRVPCTTAHPAQILATAGSFGGTPGPGLVQQSCVRAAARATQTDDPTDGGRLRIVGMPGSALACIATAVGEGMLDDSLLGLGDGPWPWTS